MNDYMKTRFWVLLGVGQSVHQVKRHKSGYGEGDGAQSGGRSEITILTRLKQAFLTWALMLYMVQSNTF